MEVAGCTLPLFAQSLNEEEMEAQKRRKRKRKMSTYRDRQKKIVKSEIEIDVYRERGL